MRFKRKFQRKVVFLSPRGGIGKSSFIANIAASLVFKGLKIGIVDLDIKGPSLEALFNIREKSFRINDFLVGRCQASSCVIDLARHLKIGRGGLFLLAASPRTSDILEIYRKGYSIDDLIVGLDDTAKDLKLDLLLIDTHSGLDEDTLISALIGDHAVVLRGPSEQDHTGTVALLTILRRLGYDGRLRPISLIINKVPLMHDPEEVRDEFEKMYNCQILAVVPFYMDVLAHMSKEVFLLKDSTHPFSTKINELSEKLLNSLRF